MKLTLAQLPSMVGRRVGTSAPIAITQERIDAFAAATDDPQWIHVDPERAAAGPYGGTIAHGFLTLSMLSHVMDEQVMVTDAAMAINYGLDRVRFPGAVPSGSELVADVDIVSVEEFEAHVMMTARVTFRVSGVEKPVCVADSVTRYVRGSNP